jgi:ribosomal protein L34E
LSSTVCVKCGNNNPEGSAFCNKCGSPLAGINYRGDRVSAYDQMQYKQQNLISVCGNCGHSLDSHTRYGANSSKSTLPKGTSNKNTACNNCSCMAYKPKSKRGYGLTYTYTSIILLLFSDPCILCRGTSCQ